MTPKILIIVRGGLVQSVWSNDETLRYAILDFDGDSEDPVICSPGQMQPDLIESDANFSGLIRDEYPEKRESDIAARQLRSINL
jgi:hypothetical protein